ncbi:MAG: UDP-N-acetylmuramoyl-L-alanyl-D-glutamate--2,6-diaminopimelate ligase [Longimicrobiales bacterium]
MALSRVLDAVRSAGVDVEEVAGAEHIADIAVGGVQQDSRTTGPGDLFVAWAGDAHDSHAFLKDVQRAGAVAALVERPVEGVELPQAVVGNARLAAAVSADLLVGSPWTAMRTAGITGTNGKTTTALILRSLLSASGPSAAIGTMGLTLPDGTIDPASEGLTTPGATQLSTWLSELWKRGTESVALEASSHALDQYRLDGMRFDVMVFTNLTKDHLDYHGGWEGYLGAKARLLDLAKDEGVAVVNADVDAWDALEPTGPVVTYGLERSADLIAKDVELGPQASRFRMAFRGDEAEARLPFPGGFNVQNALAATGAALAMGEELGELANALERAPQVPGRMERVDLATFDVPFDVLIDFAHTPDALDRILDTLRPLVEGRLIVVFGAGGDRDRTKRPEMGRAVSRYADLGVVTSDNPRTEDPDDIADQVSAGVSGIRSEQIVDRRAAIEWALAEAKDGDVVVLAGKGHETYQVIGTEKRPFDERVIVQDFLGRGRAS